MNLIYEESHAGHRCTRFAKIAAPAYQLPEKFRRQSGTNLPEVSEVELVRHYTEYSKQTFGVDSGFYPLGSCTMKYNPKVNEETAALEGFTDIHPLQPESTVQGALHVMHTLRTDLCELTGMDEMGLTPAAGAHGEFTGLCLIKAYHEHRGDTRRKKIIIPDSAHGTNPASAHMNGFEVVSIPSKDGVVDLDALAAALDDTTAGLMLTNPNTLGLYDSGILEITEKVHQAGGLCYYDGANLNAIMGISRPGDMGFDCVHLNLHKTFSTPHGGGGPGAGAVGCKAFLAPYLPETFSEAAEGAGTLRKEHPDTIGKTRAFSGNFLVVVKAMAYLLSLGREGIPDAAMHAVLSANYLKKRLSERYTMAFDGICMHEFVMTLEKEAREKNVAALDIAKGLLDKGIHPPTMYFPMIIHEALMAEPTETEGKETLDEAADAFIAVYDEAMADPEKAKRWPVSTVIGRPDEVEAARHPRLRHPRDLK